MCLGQLTAFSFERCALLRMPFIEGPPYSPNQLILMHGVFDGSTGLCCAALYSAKGLLRHCYWFLGT